ncbi:hypothetical protein LWI29_009709 [Acer saccharum]|uniref:CCHC-type domain-containing protein n=1 Tax=Acer saccharum TaxID=4024 RepID=A0AA39SYR8_ACESA|nr:hypothetical protein LWI29_009709 [Acer saccharum]
MVGVSNNECKGTALFTGKKKFFKGKQNDDGDNQKECSKSSSYNKRVKCYRCGKLCHIKMNCRVKLTEGNLAEKGEPSHDSEDWRNCFLVENTTVNANTMASINFEKDWIIDFSCGYHLIGDESNFSSFKKYKENHAIVIADNPIHHVEKEGSVVFNDGGGDNEITINHVYHVPKVKKNLFFVANAVDYGNYLLFWLKGVLIFFETSRRSSTTVTSRHDKRQIIRAAKTRMDFQSLAFFNYRGLFWTGPSVVMPEPPAESVTWVRGAAKVEKLAIPVSFVWSELLLSQEHLLQGMMLSSSSVVFWFKIWVVVWYSGFEFGVVDDDGGLVLMII